MSYLCDAWSVFMTERQDATGKKEKKTCDMGGGFHDGLMGNGIDSAVVTD